MTHAFEIKLKDPDRHTTRAEYKATSSWLRKVRNIIEPEVVAKTEKAFREILLYGYTEIN
jgi:hypothetical protein